MSMSNNAAKSAIIIIIFTLGSKVLGFLREILTGAKFGSGLETDTFFIAMTATTLITNLFSKAITTTFIPILSEVEAREGKEGKIEHTNNMINVIAIFSFILVVLAWIGAPLIVKLLASGFEGKQYRLAIELTRIGLPMIIFSGVIGSLTGFLQSEQLHKSAAAIGVPFNFVYIFFLIFLSGIFGIKGLMVASVLAVVSQLLILLPEAKGAGYKYKPVFDLKDRYIQKVLTLSIPVFISVAINDINAIVDKRLASTLVEGSISALNWANKLNGLILGVFIVAINTVIFPLLAKESNNDNIDGMKDIMGYGINLILLITIPSTIGLIVLAKPIIEVAFEWGAFDGGATDMTAQALIFYSVGLVSVALRQLSNRVYYSLQDTKTPMINGAISVVFNILFNLILIKSMGHGGLALATSLSSIISTMLMFSGLRKKIGTLGTRAYIRCGIQSGLASIVMGAVAYLSYYGLFDVLGTGKIANFISLGIAVVLGVATYGILCYVFGVEIIKDVVHKGKEGVRGIKNDRQRRP